MSLINREELLAAIMDDGGLQYPRWWYLEKVREMPEAVVMCKDCKHYRGVAGFIDGYCYRAEWYGRYQTPNDFCSRGEKKNDD